MLTGPTDMVEILNAPVTKPPATESSDMTTLPSTSGQAPNTTRAPVRRTGLPPSWLLVAGVIVVTFYPGIMSNDSLASLKQARTLEFTSWHPPIMALVWSVLDRIVEGPPLMLIAQAVLYATAAAKLCGEAFPETMRRFTPWVVVPVFTLFPPVMALNGMIWKDTWMSGLLLFALAYLFRMASASDRRTRMRSFAVIGACCLLATAFRHNAIAATAGLLAGACFHALRPGRPWLRLFCACAGGVFLAVLFMLISTAATRLIATPAHVTTPILMHDIAGIIVKSGEPEVAAQFALSVSPALSDDPTHFGQAIQRAYTPAAAGRILRTSKRKDAPFAIDVYKLDHDSKSVKQAWVAMIKRYPGAYLRHRTHAFACLLQFCGTAGWANHSYVLNPKYINTKDVDPLQAMLRKVFLNPALIRLYSPPFWMSILLGGGIVAIARRRGEVGVAFFMALSGMGLAASLFLSSPIESYRYVHWCILLGWCVLFMAIEQRLRKQAA